MIEADRRRFLATSTAFAALAASRLVAPALRFCAGADAAAVEN